jgi:hypothetical protein
MMLWTIEDPKTSKSRKKSRMVTVQSSCSDLPFPFSAAVLDVFRNLRPPAEK